MGKRTSFFYFFLLFRDAEREREGGKKGERKGEREDLDFLEQATFTRSLIYALCRLFIRTVASPGEIIEKDGRRRGRKERGERTDRIRSSPGLVERTAGSSRNRGSTDTEAIQFWPLPCTISLLSLHASLAPFTDRIRSIRQRWSLDDTRHPHETKTSRCTDVRRLCRAAHVSDRAFSTPLPRLFIIHAALPISSHSRNPNSRF